MKLYYFPAPGRAEVPRILFSIGKIAFEDIRFPGAEWASTYKAKSPAGQAPWLELDDGSTLTQSSAIAQYAASLTGYMPSDALLQAKVFEVQGALDDVFTVFATTFTIKDQQEKEATRKRLFGEGGSAYAKLQNVERLLSQSKTTYYLTDDKPTLADILVFNFLSQMRSGNMDGLTNDMFDAFSKMCELHQKVATYPPVKEYYANAEGRNSFKPQMQLRKIELSKMIQMWHLGLQPSMQTVAFGMLDLASMMQLQAGRVYNFLGRCLCMLSGCASLFHPCVPVSFLVGRMPSGGLILSHFQPGPS
eukprot:TRINITY_DN4874_c1_g2_i2.p1 TRINITY_DN4874_c1_g2~~TRINITY_DN4874_c1_g2_i2.p1  ORF type:complete len:354 (-),score=28.37 TRINITY_DN4874_c1_g2_i2:244-1158(-)